MDNSLSAPTWNSELGAFISDEHVHLAGVLHDYNHYFELQFIPPKDRDATDAKPWRIVDNTPGTKSYVMRWLSDEEMKNTNAILAWIFEGDLSKHRIADVFDKIQARERADELLKLKKKEEELEDIAEFGAFVFGDRSPNFMRHNGQTYRK
jgi:hypothetical protein